MKKDFISLKYLSRKEILKLIAFTYSIKKTPSRYRNTLKNKSIALLFEKPSLRTKAAFYLGALQVGAEPIYYAPQEVMLGRREKICDVSRTLSKFIDAVVLRTFSHSQILEFTKFSSVPVINGLSDLLHPSQVLADIFTIYELKKDLKKIKVAFIGDSNNVCHSLIYAFSILGGNLHIATPKEYFPSKRILKEAKIFFSKSKANIVVSESVKEMAKNADVLYTDVWTSMGKEKESKTRRKVFKNFQINDKILKLAKKDCIVMHCLPAHRGEEITDSVIDGRNSVVFLQAENRLHSAKAILVYLLREK